jgi:hypothetical protein
MKKIIVIFNILIMMVAIGCRELKASKNQPFKPHKPSKMKEKKGKHK